MLANAMELAISFRSCILDALEIQGNCKFTIAVAILGTVGMFYGRNFVPCYLPFVHRYGKTWGSWGDTGLRGTGVRVGKSDEPE